MPKTTKRAVKKVNKKMTDKEFYEKLDALYYEPDSEATVERVKNWAKFSPRKELLNDYQEPITDYKINWTLITLLILGLLAFLYAMHGDQQALNAGLIH